MVKERLGRDVDPSHLLVPWSRKSIAICLIPLCAARPVQSLSALQGWILPLLILAPLRGRTKEGTFTSTGCAVPNDTGTDSPKFVCRNKNSEGRDRAQFEDTNPEFMWETPRKVSKNVKQKIWWSRWHSNPPEPKPLTCTKLSTFERHKVITEKGTHCRDVTSCSRVFICENKRFLKTLYCPTDAQIYYS